MSFLENRIPPPLVAILTGLLMWAVSRMLPGFALSLTLRLALATPIALLGIAVCLAGVLSFHRARTTVNPLHPERATALVDSGIYRFTRNPMYLGFATILLAWAVLLGSLPAMIGIPAFILYMNRFQIRPEERALNSLFQASFAGYCTRVRRWL